MLRLNRCAVLLWFLIALSACAEPDIAADIRASEEYQIGVMVKAIDAALNQPEDAQALEIIAQMGTDSRYYSMIRGWIVQELRGVESQLAGNPPNDTHQVLQARETFLRTTLRRIDLK